MKQQQMTRKQRQTYLLLVGIIHEYGGPMPAGSWFEEFLNVTNWDVQHASDLVETVEHLFDQPEEHLRGIGLAQKVEG